MKLGVVKEAHDRRVFVVPGMVDKIKDLGVDILMERGAGESAGFDDDDYEHIEWGDRLEIIRSSDILLSLQPLTTEDYRLTKDTCILVSLFAPYFDEKQVKEIQEIPRQAFSMDMIPRTTLAQSMDVLSSMASIAGYKAVLAAAAKLPRYFPMMITAAGSIKPAKVLILGAGVAGLQAIATAKRLGAMVEAFDPRTAAKEEVLSLGAKFVEVEGAMEADDAGGYAIQQTEEYLEKQRILVQEKAANADVIITTAQVRGKKAPMLVPKETVHKMKSGSVIVDLAASTGGNCELTEDGKTIKHNNVYIIGDSNLAADMSMDSSFLVANNIYNFLKTWIKDGQLNLDMSNEIIESSLVSK